MHSTPEPDVASWPWRPVLRCFHRDGALRHPVCGDRATSMRRGLTDQIVGYFCDRHCETGDVAIPESYLFRRVSIVAEISFAATTFDRGLAQAEALRALEAGVEGVGGTINLHTVTSQIGRYRPPSR